MENRNVSNFLLSLTNTESVIFTLVRQIKGMAPSLSRRGQKNCVEVSRTTQSHTNDGCCVEVHNKTTSSRSLYTSVCHPYYSENWGYASKTWFDCVRANQEQDSYDSPLATLKYICPDFTRTLNHFRYFPVYGYYNTQLQGAKQVICTGSTHCIK